MSAYVYHSTCAIGIAVMRKPWTTAEIKRLAKAYESGMTRNQICELIGRPWTSIKYAIWKHSLKRGPARVGLCQTGVGGFFCAAHRDRDTGQLHGHTWDVIAWFNSPKDAIALQGDLQAVLSAFDHQVLPDNLAWGEAIADAICGRLEGCVEVQISRPSERIYARCRI